jgi:hypothetical protein
MDRYDDPNLTTGDADRDLDRDVYEGEARETHATTGGAAAAGAVTGGVIGLTGGPVGAVVGAVGGAIVGAAAERMMHSDEDTDRVAVTTPEASATTGIDEPTARAELSSSTGASTADRGAIFVDRDEEVERR